MAKLKGFNETTTFRDLKEKGLKELHIIITDLSTHRSEVANYENTPDMPVITAIRASMSIPIAFVPVKYKGKTFVDGGTLRNFPIDIFDTYLCEDGVLFPHEIERNLETLGLKLDTQEEISQILKHENPKAVKIDGSIDLLQNIMTTLLNQQLDDFVRSENYKRTVFIDTGDITTLQFELTEKQQKFLINNGRQAIENYFNFHLNS
ncbi:patatin-like phospholipase family protein [Clostridium sp. ZS2-4]|uniref:patatin-like phospholipase family protein n=1 Tax=Clostridium sp. ZS2-4 TaxID=2987703 RepID=UPI00227A4AA9|nr:patatin-like phospholipase family protein [Clostridium sp. ZS2-4]MCY6354816.1 patatin-like phospholipase family protein [Clostridium sp. ZS2-4]